VSDAAAHPGEATDDEFYASEAALDAYARGDDAEGDRLSSLAHELERQHVLEG